MPDDLIKSFRAGDELTADLVDAIIRELQRWRRMQVAPPLGIADVTGDAPPLIWNSEAPPFLIQLTSSSDSKGNYSWREVTVDDAGTVQATPAVGGPGRFPAREAQGLLSLPGDSSTVYPARFTDDGQAVLFFNFRDIPAKPSRSIPGGSPAQPTQGTLTVYMPAPTPSNPAALAPTGPQITGWNEQPTSIPTNATVWLKPYASKWYCGMYICCATTTSSSTSTTSSECPTKQCPQCPAPAACGVTVEIDQNLYGPSFDNPVCAGLFGVFIVQHQSGCTWSLVDPATGLTATLYWDGTQWTLEAIIKGSTGSGIAVYRGPGYDCKTPQTFALDTGASTCLCVLGGGGTCVATVTP